jgi:hypothetical protein
MPHPYSHDRHGRRFVREEGDRDDIRRGRGHRHHIAAAVSVSVDSLLTAIFAS